MMQALGWVAPLAVWIGVTLGARGWLARFDLIRCRAGDWGTAFAVGFTLYTGLVYALALAGVPLAWPVFAAAALAVTVSGVAAGRGAPERARPPEPPWSPADLILGAAFALLAASMVLNALYYPVMALDAHSYDGRARFFLIDGTMDLSLYHWPGAPVDGRTNISYPPLYSLGLAVTYAFGGWQSKILTAFVNLAWPLAFYGAVRQHVPRSAALAWTLLAAATPEVLAHASYALLNVPAMMLVFLEAIALWRFLGDGRRAWLALAGIAAAGATGVRPDALFLHAGLWTTAFAFTLARRASRARLRAVALPALLAVAAPLATLGTWVLYMRTVLRLESLSPFAPHDALGAAVLIDATPRVLGHVPTFGVLFYLWAVTIPGALLFRRERSGMLFPQAAATVSLLVLVAVFSVIHTEYGGGAVDVLNSSFKRAVFYLVPLAALAAAVSPPWRDLGRGSLPPGFRRPRRTAR